MTTTSLPRPIDYRSNYTYDGKRNRNRLDWILSKKKWMTTKLAWMYDWVSELDCPRDYFGWLIQFFVFLLSHQYVFHWKWRSSFYKSLDQFTSGRLDVIHKFFLFIIHNLCMMNGWTWDCSWRKNDSYFNKLSLPISITVKCFRHRKKKHL